MESIFVCNVPPLTQVLIRNRISNHSDLVNWDITQMSIESPKIGNYDDNYISLYFQYNDIGYYQYITDAKFNVVKAALRKIFESSLIWFEVTPLRHKLGESIKGKGNNFWVLLRDVEHKKSWARIK